MKKATLAIADTHFGDAAQLHQTLSECMTRAIAQVRAFEPDVIEAVVAGDAVAGRGIYRMQECQNTLPIGAEQCWYAAHDIAAWQRELKAERWVIVLGNHDNTNRENLAQQLVAVLRLYGVNAVYAGRSYTGNFAAVEADNEWYEAQHGFGGSSYYANSYAEIRAMWRQYVERSKFDSINLSRVLVGHTHWLNVGQDIGADLEIDTLGGWHRQERLDLPGAIRNTGLLLYLHDGQYRRIERVEAERALLLRESRDTGLHYQNMIATGKALTEITEWAHDLGLA